MRLHSLVLLLLVTPPARAQVNAAAHGRSSAGPGSRHRGKGHASGAFRAEAEPALEDALPPGLSSPCIWGERIFLTAHDAAADKLETICLDARHRQGPLAPAPRRPRRSSASTRSTAPPPRRRPPTAERVYVYFGSFGLLVLRLRRQGTVAPPACRRRRTGFGSATSPVLAGRPAAAQRPGQGPAPPGRRPEDRRRPSGRPRARRSRRVYPAPTLWKQGDVPR